MRFDPQKIPEDKYREASMLSKFEKWSEPIPVLDLPPVDVIVTGSVAVTRTGKRCGKGHGYGDLEYAMLRELGHPPMPVVTTVHGIQVVHDFPAESHDLPVSIIATPDELIEVKSPPECPDGIDWSELTDKMLAAMPVLQSLKASRTSR